MFVQRCEQHVGRAVDEGAELPVRHQANHRAAFAVGVERDFVMLRQFLLDALLVAAGFVAGREQCAFGGVADDFPGPVFLDEMGVVAAEEDGRQFQQRRGVRRVRRLALEAHFAVRPVAFAGDFVALAGDVERAHGHFAHRQRAGLVGADDRRRAERFDRGQLAHERAAAGHAQHAERERDGDDGGQPFRHGGHGEAHRGHEQLEEFRPAKQPQHEQQRDDAERRPDEDAPERVELLLKRRAFVRARLFNQSGDAAQSRCSSPWPRRRPGLCPPRRWCP